tara:strand:- start:241 stop:774 length:534 start_codon:yes stop_codon:yes gene_type:complete
MKKLPGFDNHILVENYKLSDKNSDNNVNSKDVKDSDKQDSKSESSNDTNDGDNKSEQDEKESDDDSKDSNVGASNPDGAGGEGGLKPGLTAITDKTYELAKQRLLDTETKFTYINLPEPNLDEVIYSNKKWLETWKNYRFQRLEYSSKDRRIKYLNWLKNDFTKFKNDNKKNGYVSC